MGENTLRSGVSESQRTRIRGAIHELAEDVARELGVDAAAVVLEIRYYHQSATNPYRTNASRADKVRSLKHHNNVCQHCRDGAPLTIADAVFHHRRRGFTGQHEPDNLIPLHVSCHDATHEVPEGRSVHKGSPRTRKRSSSG